LGIRKSGDGKVSITTELSEYAMQRFTQSTGDAPGWASPQRGRPASAAGAIEYGLMAMLIVTLVSIGATFLGHKLNGVFSTVASAMERPGSRL
jgi:Flp pilus assembly pilin Flp